MKMVSVNAAIAAGADPHVLGLEPVKVTGIDMLPEVLWAPKDTEIDVTVTHTRLIVSWPGQPPKACVAVTTPLTTDIKRAIGRYGEKYGVANVEVSDGDITTEDAMEAAFEGARLSARAKKITEMAKRRERIRNPKGVSPITIAAKRKRKAQRRDAIALAAFIDWCGWDRPTMPYGPTIDKMLAAAGVKELDMQLEFLNIEDTHRMKRLRDHDNGVIVEE